MKSGSTPLANVRLVTITLFSLGCYSICGYASDARRGQWANYTTARAKIGLLEKPPETRSPKHPDRILEILGVKPGDVVADVGCGTGIFTFSLADKVGKDGKVYATDILDGMLAYVDTKMKKGNKTNIVLVKSSESDPHLPTACCDKILLFNTYHHISNKASFFSNLRKSIKKKGTVAIIGPYRRGESPKYTDKQREDIMIKEMEKLGYRFSLKYNIYHDRYFIVFKI